MDPTFYPIEDYLAQRGRMKLLDTVVAADAQTSAARSLTTDQWPLFEKGGIRPIVIVELIAQTAGINIRWAEMQSPGAGEKEGGGLIVGVKAAAFFVPLIPVGTTIITHTEKRYEYVNYAEYHGWSKCGKTTLGEATIQILRTERAKTAGENDN